MNLFNIIRSGAQGGLNLWFSTVLPTLLPFMILSRFIFACRLDRHINRLLYPVLGRVFKISFDAVFVLFMGIAAGVPMGGALTADLVKEKRISRSEGQYLLFISNSLSLPFIVSFAALSCFKSSHFALLFSLSLYLSVFICAFIIYKPHKKASANTAPAQKDTSKFQLRSLPKIFDDAVLSSFIVITKVGGYIIVFSIMSALLQSIFSHFSAAGAASAILPGISALICCVLEVTGGINALSLSAISFAPAAACCALTFGGLCTAAQTVCVLEGSGLSIKKYLQSRLIAAILAGIIFYLLTLIL